MGKRRRIVSMVPLLVVSLALMAQAPAQVPPRTSAPAQAQDATTSDAPLGLTRDPQIDRICAMLLKDATAKEKPGLMDQCRSQETTSYIFVQNWLQYNGLLNPDGTIDGLQLIEAESDPASAVQATPPSVAAFCMEAAGDWVALGTCIDTLDRNAVFTGNGIDPGPLGADPPQWGDGSAPPDDDPGQN